MTAVDPRQAIARHENAPQAQPSLPAQLRTAAVLTWHELLRVVGASAVWLLSLVPVGAALATQQWWLVSVSTIPFALLTTGMARLGARIAAGERARVRDIVTVDPVLALALVAAGTLTERLIAVGGGIQLAGFAVGALSLVIGPAALSYGAVRGRRGGAALRGGVILAIYRPSVAVTVLALACLGGFAVVASVGALGLVVPAIVSTFAATTTAHLLATIDAR